MSLCPSTQWQWKSGDMSHERSWYARCKERPNSPALSTQAIAQRHREPWLRPCGKRPWHAGGLSGADCLMGQTLHFGSRSGQPAAGSMQRAACKSVCDLQALLRSEARTPSCSEPFCFGLIEAKNRRKRRHGWRFTGSSKRSPICSQVVDRTVEPQFLQVNVSI